MPMLELDRVHVCYGPVTAVASASIAIEKGQIVAIVGANGAGKTSLLNAIAGLAPVASGAIRFEGADVTRLAPHRRVGAGIALSPEGRQVFSDQSVRDNLALGAYSRRLSSSALEAAMDEQYRLFPRLSERRDQLSVTLSGGEQQMLAIARALMGAPRLLLLDEPSLGLAPLVIKEIFAIVEDLRGRGVTILLVEQMANLALRAADYAYVLENGVVGLSGKGSDLLRDPKIKAAYLGGH